MAIDYGTKVVGLAIYRYEVGIVLPYGRLFNDSNLNLKIGDILKLEDIATVVVGIPYFADGKETKMGKIVAEFAKNIPLGENIKLEFQDETFSTSSAKELMENSVVYNFKYDPTKVDEVAAVIILEDYIRDKK